MFGLLEGLKGAFGAFADGVNAVAEGRNFTEIARNGETNPLADDEGDIAFVSGRRIGEQTPGELTAPFADRIVLPNIVPPPNR